MPALDYPVAFPATGPVTASIKNRSGDVVVTAAGTDTVTVDLRPAQSGDAGLRIVEDTTVTFDDGVLHIVVPDESGSRWRSGRDGVDIVVTVPTGSSLTAQNGSGDISTSGELAAVDLKSGSGDVSVASATETKVKTGSGDITVDTATAVTARSGSGDIRLRGVSAAIDADTASGDVDIDAIVDGARIDTASGDVSIGRLGGDMRVKSASGDVMVARASHGAVEAKTASGSVTVAVVSGTAVRMECTTLSGRVRSELEESEAPGESDDKLLLTVQSISGSITVTRTH